MNILVVTATPFELAPILAYLDDKAQKESFSRYTIGDHTIDLLVTGVGMVGCAFGLARYPHAESIELAIQFGVGGAIDRSINLGDIVEIYSDRFGDLGVEEKDGSFTDVFQLELKDPNLFPFVNGCILSDHTIKHTYKKVKGITVNKVTGTQQSLDQLVYNNRDVQVESMEGAAFLLACRQMNIPCMQIRSISNYVETRNRASWKLEFAISELKTAFINVLNI